MAIKDDEKAFREIYDLISGKMYSLCIRYTGNTNDANDVFQEALIKLYRNLNQYKGIGSFEGWARRIFINSCFDYLKERQNLLYTELPDNEDILVSGLSGMEKLNQADLLKIISQLPTGYRLIANLFLVEGYSHREISEMLGISEGTSKSQLSRARSILQDNISRIHE